MWVSEYISKPLQIFIVALVLVSLVISIPFIAKSCNQEIDYETANANFIEEEVALHGENFSVQVIEARTVSEIIIRNNKRSSETTEKQGHYIAVTVKIKQNEDNEKSHVLDRNDFKLKDHTGTIVPLGDILACIDVTAPDVRVDNGDLINSNASFRTRKAEKDYAWIGTLIFEMDFSVGAGETKSATDIVLFKRKQPIK